MTEEQLNLALYGTMSQVNDYLNSANARNNNIYLWDYIENGERAPEDLSRGYNLLQKSSVNTINTKYPYEEYSDVPILDTAWASSKFMAPGNKMIGMDEYNRFYTTAYHKTEDTSLGNHSIINPLPQFTRYADIRVTTMPETRRAGQAGGTKYFATGLGMGRYYSEAIDDYQQSIYMQFGVAEFNSMLRFLTNAVSYEDTYTALHGRYPIEYGIAKKAGNYLFAFRIYPWKCLCLVLGKSLFRLFTGFSQVDYYYLNPTMHNYWGTVNTIVSSIAVELGIFVPDLILEGVDNAFSTSLTKTEMNQAKDKMGGKVKFDAEAMTELKALLPDIFGETTNYIDVFAIATRHQMIANMRRHQMAELYSKGDPNDVKDMEFFEYLLGVAATDNDVIDPATLRQKIDNSGLAADATSGVDGEYGFINPFKLGNKFNKFARATFQNFIDVFRGGKTANEGTNNSGTNADSKTVVANVKDPKVNPYFDPDTSVSTKILGKENRQKDTLVTDVYMAEKSGYKLVPDKDNPGALKIEEDKAGNKVEDQLYAKYKDAGTEEQQKAKAQEIADSSKSSTVESAQQWFKDIVDGKSDNKDVLEAPGIIKEVFGSFGDNWLTKAGAVMAAAQMDGGLFVGLRVNATRGVTDSFSNSTAPIDTGELVKSVTGKVRNFSFDLAGGNLLPGMTEILNVTKNIALGALDGATFGLSSAIVSVLQGAYIDMPERWDDSKCNLGSTSYSVRLTAPYGNAISQLQNIYIPLACLLAGTLPLGTGRSSHTSPYLCSVFSKGVQDIELGVITELSIERATSNLPYSMWRQPLAIDVTFTITDLSNVVTVPVNRGMWQALLQDGISGLAGQMTTETKLDDYIGVLCGRDLNGSRFEMPKLRRKLRKALLRSTQTFANPNQWAFGLGEYTNLLAAIFGGAKDGATQLNNASNNGY